MADETKTEFQLFLDLLNQMDTDLQTIADELSGVVTQTPDGALSAGDSKTLLDKVSGLAVRIKGLATPTPPAQTNPPATGDTGTEDTGTGDTQPPAGTEIPPGTSTAQ